MRNKIILLGADYMLNCRELLSNHDFNNFLIPKDHLGMYSWILKSERYYVSHARLLDTRIYATTLNISRINWFTLILIRQSHPNLIIIEEDRIIHVNEIEIADLLVIIKKQLKQHLYKIAYSNVITRIVGKGILKLLRASKSNEKEI